MTKLPLDPPKNCPFANKFALENGSSNNYTQFPSYFFPQVQDSAKLPTSHFCSHYETLTTCSHSNVPSFTIKIAGQSSVILRTEQYLVQVVICTSLTMPTLTKTHIVTLARHTNHQLGIGMALHKPDRCLLVATTSHQQKLKHFIE